MAGFLIWLRGVCRYFLGEHERAHVRGCILNIRRCRGISCENEYLRELAVLVL